MEEVIKNIIIAIFSGFGGAASLFVLFKFVIKKWIEESIKNQMDKSLALFEQKINRQDTAFNIRIQKEFSFYDKIQEQNGAIKVTVTESILFLMNEDESQFYISENGLKKLLKEISRCLEANRAYLNLNLLEILDKIEKTLNELIQIGASNNSFDNLSREQYEKKARELVVLINYFSLQLREYIENVSDTAEK